MCHLDVFEVERFLAVLAVEGSLWALAFIVTFLLVEAKPFFAGRAGDDHELALPFMVQLEKGYSTLRFFKDICACFCILSMFRQGTN